MEKTPILFLDIDGVMNHVGSFRAIDRNDMIAPECCERLFKLLEDTGAKVVLSSSWRGLPGLEERLERAGIMKHVVGRTPRLNGEICRGDEIADWLGSNPNPPERWAIVDDESDMLPEQMPFFVQTNFENGGLLDTHCVVLSELLRPNASSE